MPSGPVAGLVMGARNDIYIQKFMTFIKLTLLNFATASGAFLFLIINN